MLETAVEWFERLGISVVHRAEQRGFRPLGPLADRHGTWEVVFHKHSEDLDRFVSLTLTETSRCLDLELWAGADDGIRFVRRRVGHLNVSNADLEHVESLIDAALEAADHLQPADLTEVYTASR
jgi:hypothetical protein